MPTLNVVAAVIISEDHGQKRIFATQRGYGDFKDGWEFPGGKMEPGETPEEALKREIREELDAEIEVGRLIEVVEMDYPKFHLFLRCYFAELKAGELTLKEHEAARWLSKEELRSVDWLPADKGLISVIEREL